MDSAQESRHLILKVDVHMTTSPNMKVLIDCQVPSGQLLPLTRVMDAIPGSCDPKLWYPWNELYGSVRGITKTLADALLTSQVKLDKNSLSQAF